MDFRELGALTLFTEDLDGARDFYGNSWGLREIYADDDSTAYDLGNTILNILKISEADELVTPVAVAPRDSGARSQLTIFVDDVDDACAQLAAAGVDLNNGPVDRSWGMRTVTFVDPGGHVWELAQSLQG